MSVGRRDLDRENGVLRRHSSRRCAYFQQSVPVPVHVHISIRIVAPLTPPTSSFGIPNSSHTQRREEHLTRPVMSGRTTRVYR